MAFYDISGNLMEAVYNFCGEPMVFKPTSEKTNLDYSIASTAFIGYGEQQLPKLKAKYYATDYRSVPMFICTDEHRNGATGAHRWFSNNNDICAVALQLGDVCVDYYAESALETMKNNAMPVTNYIGIVGNHDVKQVTDVPTQEKIREYFAWNNAYRLRAIDTDDTANYVVYDDAHGIKFICLDWYTRIGVNANGTMPSPFATAAVVEWFLSELNKNEGYDVIVLQHSLFTDTYVHDDGTKQTWADAPASMERLWTVMKDRKNKRSGTYVDDEGVTHSYDFTQCDDDLICTLHGHAHEFLYLREDNLSSFAFGSWFTVSYVLLDRTNKKLHLWTNSYDSASEEKVYDI